METTTKNTIRGFLHIVVIVVIALSFSVIIAFLTTNKASAQENTATLTVEKNVDDQPGIDWEYILEFENDEVSEPQITNDLGKTTFTLEITEQQTLIFDVVETLQPEFDIISASCTRQTAESEDDQSKDNENQGESLGIFDGLDSVDGINVEADDDIYCIFTNHLHTFCGDNVVQTPNDDEVKEECDGEAGVTDEHYECTLNCTLEYIPYCGDNVINQQIEECDGADGITGDQTCSDQCTIIEPEPEPTPIPEKEPVLTPVLFIIKTVDKALANPSDTLAYTVTVSNSGDGEATNVTLVDTLPAGFTFANDDGSNSGDTERTWTWDSLAAGGDASVTYEVFIDNLTGADIYENMATVTADNYDKEVTAKVATEVKIPTVLGEELPSLTIIKSIDEEFANPGDTVTYTVTINNDSNIEASNIVLEDQLSDGFVFAETDQTIKTWELGDLAPFESVTKTYDVIIDESVLDDKYINIATVTADDINSLSAQASLEVREVEVLGEEEEALPTTGASLLLAIVSGVAVLGSGLFIKRKFNKIT